MCTLIIGIFIFVVAIFGTDLVRKVASVLSICIIAVFVQHAKSFQKPGDAAKSMGIGFVINYGTEWRGKSIHDTADLRVDHSGRGFHSCKYGGSHGKKDLQRPEKMQKGNNCIKEDFTSENPISEDHGPAAREILAAVICCIVDFGIAQFGLLTLIQKAYSILAYLAIPVILVPYVVHMVVTCFDTKY